MHIATGVFLLDRRHQPQLDEMQHGLVADATGHAIHQLGVRDRIEVARQVGIHHFRVAGAQQRMHGLDRVERAALGPVGVLLRR